MRVQGYKLRKISTWGRPYVEFHVCSTEKIEHKLKKKVVQNPKWWHFAENGTFLFFSMKPPPKIGILSGYVERSIY